MDNKPKRVVILGASGSIGKQTLAVLRQHPDHFQLLGIAVNQRIEALLPVIDEFAPKYVGIVSPKGLQKWHALNEPRKHRIHLLEGESALDILASEPEADIIVIAIGNGTQAIRPTLTALHAGKRVALATKEVLVCAGNQIQTARQTTKGELLPVDSEHSALWQCLWGEDIQSVAHVVLTASGGPFWQLPRQALAHVTPEQALRHPRWKMGAKITIDSATLMNKGLEVIEAAYLFGFTPDQIHVWIHPQAYVHGIVQFQDGSMKWQVSYPDMRIPIALALSYPHCRLPLPVPQLNLTMLQEMEFYEPDTEKFPALKLAYQALQTGKDRPLVLNVANDVAVHAFLQGRIAFTEITEVVERALARFPPVSLQNVEDVLARIQEIQQKVQEMLQISKKAQ